MQERRQPEIVAGRVNSDGSIAAGDGFTVQKAGAGSYTVTFPPGFRLISCTANAAGTPNVITAVFDTWTDRSVRVATLNISFSPLDGVFTFAAVGVQQ